MICSNQIMLKMKEHFLNRTTAATTLGITLFILQLLLLIHALTLCKTIKLTETVVVALNMIRIFN